MKLWKGVTDMTQQDKDSIVKALNGLKVKGSDSVQIKCFNKGIDSAIEVIKQFDTCKPLSSGITSETGYHTHQKTAQGERGNR